MPLAPVFGLKPARGREIIAELFEATRDYPDRVLALDRVPLERRQRLVEVVTRERREVAAELGAGVGP